MSGWPSRLRSPTVACWPGLIMRWRLAKRRLPFPPPDAWAQPRPSASSNDARMSEPPRLPGIAVGAQRQLVGLGVVQRHLAGGVPADAPAQPVGDVGEAAEGVGAVAGLDVGVGPLPALHAVEEVAHVGTVLLRAVRLLGEDLGGVVEAGLAAVGAGDR